MAVLPESDTTCPACGTSAIGPYCHACGERQPTPEDESLAAFLRDQFHEVTSADGRLWRSLRALFVPGRLTTEFFAGRRSLYVRPVRLFLVVNILFFLWISVMGGQAFRGDATLYRSNPQFDAPMSRASAEAGVSEDVYDAAFGQHAERLAPTLIAVFVPLFAALLALVLLPARASLVRHVVFSTHFVAVFMASSILVTLVLFTPQMIAFTLTGRSHYVLGDSVIIPVLLIVWGGWLVVALRRVYALPWWGAAVAGGLVATGGTLAVMLVYRWVLFYATLWTLDVPTG